MEALSPNQWTPGEFSTFNFLRNLKIMEGLKEVFFVCVWVISNKGCLPRRNKNKHFKSLFIHSFKINKLGTSLVVHLLGLLLPMQGLWVPSPLVKACRPDLLWDPTCLMARKPTPETEEIL